MIFKKRGKIIDLKQAEKKLKSIESKTEKEFDKLTSSNKFFINKTHYADVIKDKYETNIRKLIAECDKKLIPKLKKPILGITREIDNLYSQTLKKKDYKPVAVFLFIISFGLLLINPQFTGYTILNNINTTTQTGISIILFIIALMLMNKN